MVVVTPGADATFTTAGAGSFYSSPLWKFLITKTLTPNTDPDSGSTDGTAGQIVTTLNRIGSQRTVTRVLDAPAVATTSVPSDNIRVYLTDADDGFPKVATGVRDLIGLRRESSTVPYYTVRFAGTIDQIEDSAAQDDAVTNITAHDPWQYLFNRPVRDDAGDLPGAEGYDPVLDGHTTGDDMVTALLENTIAEDGHCRIDAGLAHGGTAFYTGTIETTSSWAAGDIVFQQGMMVGEAWKQLCQTNTLDIVLEPIYDPVNRPGYLAQLSIYVQAGVNRYEKIFGWNANPRSVVDLNRLIDNTQQANNVQFYAGQGGPPAPVETDATAALIYGEYWAQQFFPGLSRQNLVAAQSLAELQLLLRANGKTTVGFSPAPERSPRPFVDYDIGDRVVVAAKANGFRQDLDGLIRVYGIPLNISDDALESVQSMLVAATP